jgi:di/tricarboxylate transporter
MRDLHMRRNHQVQILAVHRGSKILHGSAMREITLRSGDTLGMLCQWPILHALELEPDLVVLTTDYPKQDNYSHREWSAVFIFIASLLLVWCEVVPFSVALLTGALVMIFTKVLTMDEAYQAISWKTIFLLAGMLPLGIALSRTGGAAWLSERMVSFLFEWSPHHIEWFLALIATVCGMVVSNVGATIVLVPVAIELASQLGVDPRHLSLLVAFAASNIFLLPNHPAHVLIMGPGRYMVRDFLRVGLGLSVIYLVVVVFAFRLMF